MTAFVLRRVVQSIPLLLLISVFAFTLIRLAPGGVISNYEDPLMTEADIERLEEALGLHEPLPVQYGKWLSTVLRGDLGKSFSTREPVLGMILDRLPATLELTTIALAIGLLVGIPLGVLSALRPGSRFDSAVRVLTVAGSAVPHWWLGLLAIVLFAGVLHILPSAGRFTIGRPFDLLDHLRYLLLPALILSTGPIIAFSRFVRAEVREVLSAEFVRTAESKGLSLHAVMRSHVLRNALIPLVTLLGLSLPGLFSGAALTEIVFSWPGLGQMALAMATRRDLPVLMGLIMISSFLVVLGNLLADLLYGVIDPRVRYS
ncbi:MAG TPA: ABC transporter permease [Chloroflexota bacterium]|nr:ABC transporter permease [Chloroflexota bacterium]